MPDNLILTVSLLAPFLAAFAIGSPRRRRPMGYGLAACAGFFLVAATLDADQRTLDVTNWFPGLSQHEVSAKEYLVSTETYAGGWWAAALAGFWGVWASWALYTDYVHRRRNAGAPDTNPGHPLVMPLALAWGCVALWVCLQPLAAPEILIQPAGIDRVLLPATFAAAMLVAARAERYLTLFVMLGVFIYLTRVPVALAMSIFSDNEWGTALDVHKVTSFADPMSQRSVRVDPHDHRQSAWLIYAQQLIILPTLFMMSLGGICFFLFMLRRAPERQNPLPAA